MLLPTKQTRGLIWASIGVTILLLGAISIGATRSEYDISFDSSGALAGGAGDGYGGTWYHYEHSDEYIMWFYNQPYDPTRKGILDVWAYIAAMDSNRSVGVQASYGWATPEWSALGKAHPPLPQDVTNQTLESRFMQRISIYYEDSVFLGGSVEPHVTDEVSYNPDWVCIIVKGRNLHVYRWISHDCVLDTGGGTVPDNNDAHLGACCNTQTGECYIATGCVSPFVALGAGTSCTDCKAEYFTWDFGDAPAPYPTLMSQNGARHTVKPGIYLGACASKDKDGKPSAIADADDCDDGVAFTSAVVPGHSATVQITASANGVINGWIDFKRNGNWTDSGEKIFVDEPVRQGSNTLSFTVPSGASVGDTFARFRFSTVGGLNATGLATDGEVEDYRVQITAGSGGENPPPGNFLAQSPLNKYYPKWSQPAKQTTGLSIQGWPEVSSYLNGPVLADDWADQDRKPVIGIRWWGCFDNWIESAPPTDLPGSFHIGIWTDAIGTGSPSTLVWETTCTNWAWTYSGLAQESFGQSAAVATFEFSTLFSQDKWFYPTSAMGSQYWVSISAVYGGQATAQHPWGFLTRQSNYGSGATRIQQVGSIVPGQAGQWPPKVGSVFASGLPVVYPQNVPWDLSFELISSKPGDSSGGGDGGGIGSGLKGDVNGDGKVDSKDMAALLNILFGANGSK